MKINHTMCISKILTDSCAIKQKHFRNVVYNHKENCLIINGKQSVKTKKWLNYP